MAKLTNTRSSYLPSQASHSIDSGRGSREWNAGSYDKLSRPMERLGRAVLERLELTGSETVLDAGCGSGRVTAALLQRLPQGRVVALDGSQEMLKQASRRLADYGERVGFVHCDLAALELEQPVDAIFSTATFHWVLDHRNLFTRLYEAVKPGGQLVAQCGGVGNIAGVLESAARVSEQNSFAPYLSAWPGPWRFAGPEATAQLLEEVGFSGVRCWLEEVTVVPEDELEYLKTVVLGSHLERLPAELQDGFVAEVARRLPQPLKIGYVRLNICARRP